MEDPKCFNCDREAVYAQDDPGLSPVMWCEKHLPPQLKGRADNGDLDLAKSKSIIQRMADAESSSAVDSDSGSGHGSTGDAGDDSPRPAGESGTGTPGPKPSKPGARTVPSGVVPKTADTNNRS